MRKARPNKVVLETHAINSINTKKENMKKIRYAVVGLNHGREHIAYAMEHDSVELSAVCDKNEAILSERSKAVPSAKPFSDYDQMLAWGQFDAVIIAVPPFLHKEFGIKAVKAGKHVFMEKPLTGNLRASRELRDAVKAAKPVFQVGYCVRSSQLIQRLLTIIRSGSLGDVVHVWWSAYHKQVHVAGWRESRAGCLLFDCSPHYLDIMQLLAGAPFHRMSAYGNEPGKIGANPDRIPQVTSIVLEYRNGVRGGYTLSEITPVTGNCAFFGVAGTRGIVYGNPWDPQGAGSLECQLEDGLYLDTVRINGTMASRGHLGFKEQHAAFLKAIATGAGNPCTIDDGYEVDLIMAAVDRSLTSGQSVTRAEMEAV